MLYSGINFYNMNRIYSLLALLGLFFSASAQRQVDLEVTEMLSPTQLNSTSTGTNIQVTAVLKNNGPDEIVAGDSIAYQVVLRTSADQLIVAIPNGSLYTRTMTKTLASGDTLHFRTSSFNVNLKINSSATIKLQILATALNRGSSGIATETAAQLANNLLSKSMVWYNEQGWGVGINDQEMTSVTEIHPNPAIGRVSVNWLLSSASDEPTELTLMDLTGNEILHKYVPSSTGRYDLDLEGVNSGLYILQVRNGEHVQSSRLSVGI